MIRKWSFAKNIEYGMMGMGKELYGMLKISGKEKQGACEKLALQKCRKHKE